MGGKSAKNISHLQKEIDDKETVLKVIDNELVRVINIVAVCVEYKGKRLIEDRQEFTDGRVRRREMSWCGEKQIQGETAEDSAVRCLAEEIGISIDASELFNKDFKVITENSRSYPGLKTIYHKTFFNYNMTDENYDPNGYVEHQDDKKTFFVWQ